VPPCTGLGIGLCTALNRLLNRPLFRALCRCAGGSYPSHPTSPVQSTAWERGSQRKRAAASWHWSRIGMGLLCAPKGIAESFIFRMVNARPEMCARDSRHRAASAGLFAPAGEPANRGTLRAVRMGGVCSARLQRLPATWNSAALVACACRTICTSIVRSDRGYSRHRCYRLPWAGPRWLFGSWQPSHGLCKVRLHRLDHACPFACDRSPPE
jgi:hypothetical protein